MSKTQPKDGLYTLEEIGQALEAIAPETIADAMRSSSTQRGAVLSGLSAAVMGVVKAIAGRDDKYVPRKKKETPKT